MVDVSTKYGLKTSKPIAVVDYNEAKSYIDVSDSKTSYASTIRKGIKWYKKVGRVVNKYCNCKCSFIIPKSN